MHMTFDQYYPKPNMIRKQIGEWRSDENVRIKPIRFYAYFSNSLYDIETPRFASSCIQYMTLIESKLKTQFVQHQHNMPSFFATHRTSCNSLRSGKAITLYTYRSAYKKVLYLIYSVW
jgi:hypothetical protein